MTNSIVSSNSSIEVSDHQGQLVVDSRLIATNLNIQHETVIKSIRKYAAKFQAMGVLRFEIGKLEEGSTGRPEQFVYLNELQSNFLMTLSKNTDAVVECKFNLSIAFDKAKSIIKTVIPAQSARIRELELENENLKLRRHEADRQDFRIAGYGLATTLLLEGKGDAIVEVDRPTIEVIDAQSGAKFSGQTTKQLAEYLNKNGGRSFKSGAELERELNKLGRADLVDTVPRKTLQPFVSKENLSEACRILTNNRQQRLLGE
jgi:phage regulator Rha-like protein